MDASEAISIAKAYVQGLYAAEGASNFGLEELRFDDTRVRWVVTIGFSRPWDGPIKRLGNWPGETPLPRTFKIVEVRDSDGKIMGMTHRQIAA